MFRREPKVSIVVPVYNREDLILETLNSAVRQTYKNVEIIVVDNKSEDKTFDIIKKFSKKYQNVNVFQNEKNIGPIKNWQKCVEYSTGEYIKILWSDDLIDEKFIEKTLPYLVDNKDVGFVFTGVEVFDRNTRIKFHFIGETGVYNSYTFIHGSLSGKDFPVSPGNAIFRKKDLERNILSDIPNKFGVDFKRHVMGIDALIYLLTAKDYTKFAFINESLSFFRSHKEAITISEGRLKRPFRYSVAKAYFAENYFINDSFKNRLNYNLLSILARDICRRGFNFIRNF